MLEVWASAQPVSLTPDTVAVGRVWLLSDAAFASFGHGLQLRRQDSLSRRNGGMLAKDSAAPRWRKCCRASYFDGSYKQSRSAKKKSLTSGEFAQESNASSGHLVGEGMNLPKSLRVLKRQQQQRRKNPAETSSEGGLVGCSMKKAFSSMVYMLKSMQSYTLQMRQLLFCEDQFQEMWSFVQRETHASFLWLFQQVFACTPKLMISVMILLANFTVYSMDSSLAMGSMLPTVESPSSPVSCLVDSAVAMDGLSADADADAAAPLLAGNNNNGSRGGKSVIVAGGMDGDGLVGGFHHRRTMYSQEESAEVHAPAEIVVHAESLHAAGMNSAQVGKDPLFLDAEKKKTSSDNKTPGFDEEVVVSRQHMERSEELIFKFLLQEAAKETEMPHKIALELDTRQTLVAPVTAKLEPDNYECYDRTDLLYQHALSLDGANPLLLANYAQFLHVVRHDHDRAENFFRRATGVDPSDGEVMSRFASFLWLARGDQSGAEAAYKDAIASDPSNPFYAGSYAHFLWHAGEEEAPCVNPAL